MRFNLRKDEVGGDAGDGVEAVSWFLIWPEDVGCCEVKKILRMLNFDFGYLRWMYLNGLVLVE